MKIEIEIPDAYIEAEVRKSFDQSGYGIREIIWTITKDAIKRVDWAKILANAIDENAERIAAEVVSVALRKASAKQLQMAMKFAEASHD